MPRKRKSSGENRRETSGKRWKRNRANMALNRELGLSSCDCDFDCECTGPIHQRIEMDSLEFACLFTTIGGRKCIGDGIVRVFDRHGRNPGTAVAPNLLEIGRDKASQWMARCADVAAIMEIRENLREERKQKQVLDLLDASERGAFGWHRQVVPDQVMRSVLSGSNNGKDPTCESESQVICFKSDDGRYRVAEETWDGSFTDIDNDGFRDRVGVTLSELPVTFSSEKEAHAAILYAIYSGGLERFADRKDARFNQRMAAKLRAWEHQGSDMKSIYKSTPKRRTGKTVKGKRARVNPLQING